MSGLCIGCAHGSGRSGHRHHQTHEAQAAAVVVSRPAGSGLCWCPDCRVTTPHDIDVITDTTDEDFRAAMCRDCGHLTALDTED